MTATTDQLYRLKASLRLCSFEDGAVVFDLESRACREINRSAALVLGHLIGGKTLEEIVAAVEAEFDRPPDSIRNDLIEFIKDLVRRDWLHVEGK